MEKSFSSGLLHTLFCTSTLAAGINLPARRCVIRAGSGRMAVKRAQYLQMIGRAGRAGKCPVGESFFVCEWGAGENGAAVAAARALLAAPMPQLRSNLVPRGWAAASGEQRGCASGFSGCAKPDRCGVVTHFLSRTVLCSTRDWHLIRDASSVLALKMACRPIQC